MFAGVIFARDEAPGAPDELIATLPFAGATLIETQLRRLHAVGASRLFVVAARVPAALNAALDRQRRAGIAVELVRRAADLAEALDPAEPVLVVADGVIASEEVLATVARADAPALLAIADAPQDTRMERIDAGDHWAGVALVDAALLERTVTALGDWDLQSTLLRRTAQAGATRRYLAHGAGPADLALIGDASETAAIDAARMAALIGGQGRIAEQLVSRWIAQPLATLARQHAIHSRTIATVALAIAAVGLVLSAIGWLATGALLTLFATVGFATARIGFWHAFADGDAGITGMVADGVALALLVAMVPGVAAADGPAPLAIVLATIAALVLGRRAWAEQWRWAPTPVTVAALVAVGALVGLPGAGLVLVGVHALVALAIAIERLRGGKQG